MKDKGFSIVELVIATGIMVVISVIVFVGYRYMGRQTFLEGQAGIMMNSIEKVRNTALSAVEMKKGSEQVEYFTIHFYEDHYVLFEGTNEAEITNYFERDVKIVDGVGEGIGFKPPEPEIIFWDSAGNEKETDYLDITLNYGVRPIENVVIRVNKAGLIYLYD